MKAVPDSVIVRCVHHEPLIYDAQSGTYSPDAECCTAAESFAHAIEELHEAVRTLHPAAIALLLSDLRRLEL